MSAIALLATAGRWTPLLLLAFVLTRSPRVLSASCRHLVWTSALIGLMILPGLELLVPSWDVPGTWQTPAARQAIGRTIAESPATKPPAPRTVARTPEVESPANPPAATGPRILSGSPAPHVVQTDVLLGIWGAVTAVLLIFWGSGQLAVRQWARKVELADSADLDAAARSAARGAGLRRRFRVLIGDGHTVPMTWGFLHPVILLPESWTSWSRARLQSVLLHELAHVRRCDALVQALARLVAAIFWFHPGVWYALRRQRAEAEKACDDAVLKAGLQAPDYAGHLLDLASTFRRGRAKSAVAMARPSGLGSRIGALLDDERPRKAPPGLRAGVVLATLLVTALLAGLGTSRAELPEKDWLSAVEMPGTGRAAWVANCGRRGALCDGGTQKALSLLLKAGHEGTVVVQEIKTGVITTYVSTSGEASVPLVKPASLAKLALAALWWESGRLDEKRACPGILEKSARRGRKSIENYGRRDHGMIHVPHQMLVLSCNTAAATMAEDLLEVAEPHRILLQFAALGFGAPGELPSDDSFWGPNQNWSSPPRPFAGTDPAKWREDWPYLAIGQGAMATTTLHISRLLQAIGNDGVMLSPRPPSAPAAQAAAVHRVMSAKTAARLRLAMAHVVSEGTGARITPQLEWSDWQLGGKTATHSERHRFDGWFAGLAYDASNRPRFTVVVRVEDGGPGSGSPAGIAAEMTRFLARATGDEL